jgi:hypothetical protein
MHHIPNSNADPAQPTTIVLLLHPPNALLFPFFPPRRRRRRHDIEVRGAQIPPSERLALPEMYPPGNLNVEQVHLAMLPDDETVRVED